MKAPKQTTKIVRQLRSGQITIPVEFRRELGIEGEGMLQMTLKDGELRHSISGGLLQGRRG